YLLAGAAELRNPHPRFDAHFYVDQHPNAADNPLLYHLWTGLSRGYLTEKPIDISDYLPTQSATATEPCAPVDVVVPVLHGLAATRRCLLSVLADRTPPLVRITVIADATAKPDVLTWLQRLAANGEIHLIHSRRKLGHAASVNLGITAAGTHDVAILHSNTKVSAGWLRRLGAVAWSNERTACVSPLSDTTAPSFGLPQTAMDEVCRMVNAGRSVRIPLASDFCMYIRRDALRTVGAFSSEFCPRAEQAGWQNRLAFDTFVSRGRTEKQHHTMVTHPFCFAVTAAVLRRSGRPVILMVAHDMGGGVGRHIRSLGAQLHGRAHVLLLEGTDRGAALSLPGEPDHPILKLPSDRLDDLALVLRSANLSRVHIHHQLHMDMDIRRLIHRLGVPFDVTVHDYFAICPQVNLLRWPEGVYCGEPGPAGCNACIADSCSHGARDILTWRRERAWQFIHAERVICPSADVKTRLARYGVGDQTVVVPHETTQSGDWPIRRPTSFRPPLRVVLLGVLADHKGSRTVAAVAEAAAPGTIQLHLVGHLEPSFPRPAAKLIQATGQYREAYLDGLLRGIKPHVFWFPSSAAETYSYTLGTAIATGLPIVATRLGSFPERLAGRPNTWLVDHRATTAEYLAIFQQVQTTLRAGATPPRKPRPQANSDFYDAQYLSPNPVAPRPARPRIVVLPEREENGSPSPCAYIRLLQPLDHPAIGGGFDILLADRETVLDYDADIIVTQRHAVPDAQSANRLAAHAQRVGAKLLFDLDDDLLSVPPSHPDAAQLRPRASGVRRMLAVADAVWVSTPGLAARLSAIRPDALVIENRLDERIWFSPPVQISHWDDPVRILCMGTDTHDRDFALIEPVLARLKADFGDRIAIDILGMTRTRQLSPGLNRTGPSPHATRSYPGFVDWLNRRQPAWHIGLAPLLDTPFNRCKSPIKVMDYAAIGLVTLASDVPSYRGSIADGPAGQLVSNDPVAWTAALDWLIRDQAFRRASAERARRAFATHGTLLSAAAKRLLAWKSLLSAATTGLRRDEPALTIAHDQSHSAPRTRRHSGRGQ
ncbi:MAG TPA: glycosyltransferase, partial [Rhodopila sp.]